jgi:hypothetical protein
MMTTAYQTTKTGTIGQPNGANSALDYGSGHVEPSKMLNPGLIFEASFADYARYVCTARSPVNIDLPNDILSVCRQCRVDAKACDPVNLNMPSISAPLLVGVTRTVVRTGMNTASQQPSFLQAFRGIMVPMRGAMAPCVCYVGGAVAA